MTYESQSRNQTMEIEDMHQVHIKNVLLKNMKRCILTYRVEQEMVRVYIQKVTVAQKQLYKKLNGSRGVARLLLDILTSGPVQPSRDEQRVMLALYRKIARALIDLHGEVSADVIRKSLGLLGIEVNGSVLSHVFKSPYFQQKHYKRSSWAGANGRYINTWIAA